MTDFYYAGYRWGFVKTHSIAQRKVRDPSDTDGLYIEFTISLDMTLAVVAENSAEYGTTTVFPSKAGESPAETIARIRHHMLQERKPLLLMVAGRIVLQVGITADGDSSASALDDANGPKPVSCDVTEITGTQSFRILYTVTVRKVDCDESIPNTSSKVIDKNDWLSLRYTGAHDIDEKGYSVIRYSGKLICRSSIIAKGGPDMLRGMATPIPIPGFKRSSQYYLSSDGLSLSFNVVDHEVYLCPPPGTVNANGTHTVATSTSGAIYWIDVRLTLEGRKEMGKQKLMEMCVAIAVNRLMRSTPMKKEGTARPLIKEGSFSEETHGPGCTVHLRAMAATTNRVAKTKSWLAIAGTSIVSPVTASLQALKKLAEDDAADKTVPKLAALFNFGGDPMHSNRMVPIPLTFSERGYLPAFKLIAAAFQDPCLQNAVKETSLVENVTNETWADMSNPTSAAAKMTTGSGSTMKGIQQTSPSIMEKMISGAGASTFAAGLSTTTVSIVDGSVDAFDYTDALLNEEQVTDGVWSQYYCHYAYFDDTGKRAMPAMQDDVDVAYPKIHSRVMTIEVAWIAEKIDAAPTVPDKEPTDTNLVLLDSYLGMSEVNFLGGDVETLIYTAKGVYRYGALNASAVNTRWPMPPWMAVPETSLKTLDYGDAFSGEAVGSASESGLVSQGNP